MVEYTYTRLAGLFGDSAPALQSTVHVYGVVAGTSTGEGEREGGRAVRVVDETLGAGQTVLLRVESASGAPEAEARAFCAGCVLRVHRAVLRSRTGGVAVLRGRVAEVLPGGGRVGRLSWVVFSAATGDVVAASSPQYTFTPRDRDRVQQLRLWAASLPPAMEEEKEQEKKEQQKENAALARAPRRAASPSEGALLSLAQVEPTVRPFSCIVYVCVFCFLPSFLFMCCCCDCDSRGVSVYAMWTGCECHVCAVTERKEPLRPLCVGRQSAPKHARHVCS